MSGVSELPIGERFGRWTVLGADPNPWTPEQGPPRRKTALLCRCECGTERAVLWCSLRDGLSKQCTACHLRNLAEKNAERPAKRHHVTPGQRFGSWTVLGDESHMPRRMLCRCDCGLERAVLLHELVRGRSLQCAPCGERKRRRGTRESSGPLHYLAVTANVSASGVRSSQLCDSWQAAVDALAGGCLLNAEQRLEVWRHGYLRLRGAACVEIVRCDCATPEVHARAEAAE